MLTIQCGPSPSGAELFQLKVTLLFGVLVTGFSPEITGNKSGIFLLSGQGGRLSWGKWLKPPKLNSNDMVSLFSTSVSSVKRDRCKYL